MARLKRSSPTLEKAQRRAASMQSISSTLDFSNGLSLVEYDHHIQTLQTQLSNYNTLLSTLDEMASRISLAEAELSSYSEKMLMSVATHYGKNSVEYIQAGGKPRKSSSRRSKPEASTQQANSSTVGTLATGLSTATLPAARLMNGLNTNGKSASVS